MNKPLQRQRMAPGRAAARLAAALIAFGAGGCVYLHLRELKNQLAQFDRYFMVQNENHPTVVALQPVMDIGDVASLLQLEPSSVTDTGGGLRQTYYFEKQKAPGDNSTGNFDLPITMLYVEDRLTKLGLPDRYADFINPASLQRMFRSMDQAEINTADRLAAWKAPTSSDEVSKLNDVVRYLGPPSARQDAGDPIILTYTYRLAGSGRHPSADPDAWLNLTLQKDNHRLLETEIHLGRLAFKIDFSQD